MADITKCNGFGCSKKDTCYRFLAKENPYWQAYGQFPVENCTSYWPVKSEEEKSSLDKKWED